MSHRTSLLILLKPTPKTLALSLFPLSHLALNEKWEGGEGTKPTCKQKDKLLYCKETDGLFSLQIFYLPLSHT
jgi:hypothetical protein